MSAREERTPLNSRTTSLYDYALFRHGIEPDGRVPAGGYPLPGDPPSDALRFMEATRVLAELLGTALDDSDPARAAATLDRRLPELGVHPNFVQHPVTQLTVTDESAARVLGRRLVRTATSAAGLGVGIHLLTRLGGPEDVPRLTALALLRGFLQPSVRALSALGCDTDVLIALGDLLDPDDHGCLIDELADHDDPAARQWLLDLPPRPHTGPARARHIATAVRFPDLLEHEPVSATVLAQAGRMLTRMAQETGSQAEILRYKAAVPVYEALVRRADRLPPSLDHHAILLSLALDLSSGPPVLLDWRPGLREELLGLLEALLSSPERAEVLDGAHAHEDRYRAAWIRRMCREPFERTAPAGLRIHVVERDPEIGDHVETRILLDGRPLVPQVFPEGLSGSPEFILGTDLLHATPEEREVTLSTAYCSEGCCGTLSVTVKRDGDHVVWHGRHQDGIGPRLPEHRFDAAAYDAEVERARTDDGWCRAARSTVRLIEAGLGERPDLLARWDIPQSWCRTVGPYEDTVEVHFWYGPGVGRDPAGDEAAPWVCLTWRLADDGRRPEERAAAALERIATTDPKTYCRVTGGNPEYARALGLRPQDDG
ncbi:hypothetical protein ACFQ7B_05395 [Streptomyces erythrochromogenes]|uniref:hypothetical protein n=1 Tax=Streptomyces erythrochromogenes TaxID=285574 RepID=UPI0036C6D1AC